VLIRNFGPKCISCAHAKHLFSLPPDQWQSCPGIYDGYRLIVARDGDRVRLFTRNGHDWSNRYPWIVESALKNRHKQFAIDGEA